VNKYNVLFVDDEVQVLRSLRRGLREEPYQCFFANSGREALEIMEKESFALIVSDMRMPGMTGLQLLQQVQESYPEVVCIILSGYTQLQQILTTINQIDIFKFITKPWRLEEEFKAIIQQGLTYYKMKEGNLALRKSLEAKNQAYQNILGKIDATTERVKHLTAVLGKLGNNLLAYEEPLLDIDTLQMYKKYVYNKFAMATLNDAKYMSEIEAMDQVYQALEKMMPIIRSETLAIGDKSKIYLEMVIGVLSCVIFVLKTNTKKQGVQMAESLDRHENIILSLVIQALEGKEKEQEKKVDFLQKMLHPLCKDMNMAFIIGGNQKQQIFQLVINKR